MRKLASVQKIEEVKDIPNADRIQAYRVQGWWVVDQKDKYQVGDKVIYCEVDSWIPHELAPFLSKGQEPKEYNGVKGNRLRTIKLKGQLSQGLILPISLKPLDNPINTEFSFIGHDLGSDVSSILGIQKWEAPIPAQLQGVTKGNFPSFIKKTDQERAQNLWDWIEEEGILDVPVEITTKLDGSSITVYCNKGEVGVCSRNLDLKLDQEGNTFVDTAMKSGILDKLKQIHHNTARSLAIQAELMGEGIQKNREGLKGHDFFIYDIWDIDRQCYLGHAERMVSLRMIDPEYSYYHVPVLYSNQTLRDIGVETLDDLLKLAEGPSLNNPVREGIVIKAMGGSFSFKAISNKFLMKNGD